MAYSFLQGDRTSSGQDTYTVVLWASQKLTALNSSWVGVSVGAASIPYITLFRGLVGITLRSSCPAQAGVPSA